MSTQSTPDPIIDLTGVWYTYPGVSPIEALRGVDLSIHAGEYVALIGANGSGKSTLARHLNGLLLPDRGQVRVGGWDTHVSSDLPAVRRMLQMIFQHPDAQIVANTVEEDVAFGPENFGVPTAEMVVRVREALEQVGMWEYRERAPHQLSAGQKQRVAIASALAVKPQILVLDEATAMLDPAGSRAVLALLEMLHQDGTTIVTITHEMEEAAQASRIVILDHGQVVLDGSPRTIFQQGKVLRSLGLDLPPLANLAANLNLPVCLTPDELVAALGPAPAGLRFDSQSPVKAPYLPPQNSIIRIRDLSSWYLRGTPLETQALMGVNLDLERGQIGGLIGPTGSGKSTLLQHLNGLMRPHQGSVVVDDLDWSRPDLDAHSARLRVGLLFQQAEDQLFEHFLGDDVAFGPRQLGLDRAEVRRRVQTAMDSVGLPFETFKDRRSQTLSGGEQRRAALAGVLALDPILLAADEPTAGLDPRGRADILRIFLDIQARGVSLLVSSHRLDDLLTICQTVTALQSGQVAASGPTRELLSQANEIERLGIPAMPLADAGDALRKAGWPVPYTALTVPEITFVLAGHGGSPHG